MIFGVPNTQSSDAPSKNPARLEKTLRWSKEQLSLRNEAHHRANFRCDAPAVIWQLGFWPEREQDPQDAENVEQFNQRLSDWTENKVQGFVDLLLKLDQPKNTYKPRSFMIVDREENIWTAQPKYIDFSLIWHGLEVQTRIEIHPDYATAAFLIALGQNDDDDESDEGLQDDFATQLREAVKNASSAVESKAGEAADLLYDEVWRRFTQDILARSESISGSFAPGEVFVSLCGVILKLEKPEEDEKRPLLSAIRPSKDDSEAPQCFEADTAHKTIKKLEYFLSRDGFDKDDREFVAARIIQSRAIFISPFGARSRREEREQQGEGPRRSTRFCVLTKGHINSRQLGRSVSQIVGLGTLQIVALKDIGRIREAGTAIRLEGDTLDSCSKKISDKIGSGDSIPKDLEIELCQIEQRLDAAASKPVGGLSYRIFRAKYYSGEFTRRLKNLEAAPIHQWQLPGSFFDKRLFSVYEYIENVGTRMDRLRRRISNTLETVQTKTQVELTAGVHRIQELSEKIGILIFVVTVAAFFGEIVVPFYNAFIDANDVRQLQNIINQYVYLIPDKCVTVKQHMMPGSASEVVQSGDIFVNTLEQECVSIYKMLGYVVGVATSILVILAFLMTRLRRSRINAKPRRRR